VTPGQPDAARESGGVQGVTRRPPVAGPLGAGRRQGVGGWPAGGGRLRRLSWALALLVFLGTAGIFYERAVRVGYNTDEGQAIWPAQYFEFLFLQGKTGSPEWDASYWTLTQVPVYRYVIGAAVWLSGQPFMPLDLDHRRDEVSGPDRAKYLDPAIYRDERKLAESRRVPRPSPEVLWAARVPMVLLGAGTALLLYIVATELAGPLAGLVAAVGFVAAPFVQTLLPRAHTEAPFLFFLVLALWLSMRAARASVDPAGIARRWDRRSLVLGALAGLAVGLSAGSKLTGVLALAALASFAGGTFVLAWLGRRRAVVRRDASALLGPVLALERSWRWSALAAVVGLAVFLAVNPFLWPNPIDRTRAMLQFRQQEMFGQRTLNQELAVPEGIVTRLGFLLYRSGFDEPWAARRLGVPVEGVLMVVGVAVAATRVVRRDDRGGGPEPGHRLGPLLPADCGAWAGLRGCRHRRAGGRRASDHRQQAPRPDRQRHHAAGHADRQ
jgi:hypothetical protein